MRNLRWTLIGVFMVLGLGVLSLQNGCASLTRAVLYHPDTSRVEPASVGLPQLREEVLTAPDGAELIVWRTDGPAPEGDAGGTHAGPRVVYFHGNASNLANRAGFFRYFVEEGFGFAALSYRGFGGSDGRPSEADIIADALMMVDHLYADGWEPETTVLYGESLGSGVAVQVGAQRDVAGVVVHAPYAAIDDLMAAKAPWALPKLLTTDRYRSVDVVADINAPLLWLHGDRDSVIPMRHGQRLFDAAVEPKTSAIVEGARHQGLYGRSLFAAQTAPFVRRVTAQGVSPSP